MTVMCFRNIGIVILVAGILSLFVTLIYCMCICQETTTNRFE